MGESLEIEYDVEYLHAFFVIGKDASYAIPYVIIWRYRGRRRSGYIARCIVCNTVLAEARDFNTAKEIAVEHLVTRHKIDRNSIEIMSSEEFYRD